MGLRARRLGRAALPRPLVGLVVSVAVLAVAAPAWAQAEQNEGAQVVLTGRAEVRAGERADSVVIVDGPAVIDGSVQGHVVALNGDIRVTGTVKDDVVALNGRATIESGAHVGGDVVSSRAPQVAPGATVEGETRTIRFSLRAIGVLFWLAWWVAVTVSILILGLLLLALAPAALAAAVGVARNEPGPALGWGVLCSIGLPVVSVVAIVTLIGIPLGLLGLLASALLYALGYVVAAFVLGRMVVKEPRSRYLALLAGVAILRVAGLIPVLGGLVTFLAGAFGLGALVIAGWRTARAARDPDVGAPAWM